jgi:signal transduction histidine kinase
MFSSLARRLTAWYVFVAVALVVLLAGAVIAVGLVFYARDANDQIAALARQVPDIEARAISERDDWQTAQSLLVRRLSRPGFMVRTQPPPPRPGSLPRDARYGFFHYPPVKGTTAAGGSAGAQPQTGAPPQGGSAPQAGDLPRRPPDPPPFFTNRFGFGAATTLGVRPVRTPFLNGNVVIFVDLERVQSIVTASFAVLGITAALAALVAWGIGRYITSQALRPLYDVTSALVRFAGRDFTAQPIDVAGRSEFDELVRAYNAAANQVASAFAERATAEAQMRQFVADAGHELRTPLTIVLGYIDMLKRRAPADERSKRIFDTIASESSRMRTLIDNLVLLARLEGADRRLIEPFALTPLLEDDVARTRLGLTPGVQFELDIAVDATIIGDRGEIYEAIANLVDNAIKYAPGCPIRIAVKRAPDGVEVTVSDRGPGIAQADRGLIFDRFYRGSRRTDVEGSGLGLAIAKRAIERAGGTLSLASSSDQGTTFRIELRADTIVNRKPASAPH